MLGVTFTSQGAKSGQLTTLLAPASTMIPTTAQPTPVATTPAWVPWAIGAAIGGGVLFLLLRK